MAVSLTTYGSTLSDLQRLTNEDRALDYQRANFQDDINARRLSEFLKARSEDNKVKSQRDSEAAKLLDAQQDRAMRGSQFNTQQGNLMKIEEGRNAADIAAETARARSAIDLAKLQGSNALEVAKIQGQNRQIDPRYFQALAETEALNQEGQQQVEYAERLSNARKATLAAKNSPMQASEDSWGWGNPEYKKRITDAETTLKQLDATATSLGLAVAPDGGYVIPPFKPIQVPAFFNQGVNPVAPAQVPIQQPAADPFPFLSTDAPPARTLAPIATPAPVRRFRVTPDGRTIAVP